MNNHTSHVAKLLSPWRQKIYSAVSGLFLKLIYHGTSTIVHLLLLKFSMVWNGAMHVLQTFWVDTAFISFYIRAPRARKTNIEAKKQKREKKGTFIAKVFWLRKASKLFIYCLWPIEWVLYFLESNQLSDFLFSF